MTGFLRGSDVARIRGRTGARAGVVHQVPAARRTSGPAQARAGVDGARSAAGGAFHQAPGPLGRASLRPLRFHEYAPHVRNADDHQGRHPQGARVDGPRGHHDHDGLPALRAPQRRRGPGRRGVPGRSARGRRLQRCPNSRSVPKRPRNVLERPGAPVAPAGLRPHLERASPPCRRAVAGDRPGRTERAASGRRNAGTHGDASGPAPRCVQCVAVGMGGRQSEPRPAQGIGRGGGEAGAQCRVGVRLLRGSGEDLNAREDSLPSTDARDSIVFRARVTRSFRRSAPPASEPSSARDAPAEHGRSAQSPRVTQAVAGRLGSPSPGAAVPGGAPQAVVCAQRQGSSARFASPIRNP